MKRWIITLVLLVAGFFLIPVIVNPYFFVCPGSECRYNLERVVQFYKSKFDSGYSAEEQRRLRNEALKFAIFYRVQADYEHIDRNSGETEKVNFDFVVMCDKIAPMDPEEITFSRDNPVPGTYMHKTADDGLVIMRVPHACQSHQFVPSKLQPDDFTPFVVWFDDVNKMDRGWGYASEAAYESPFSQLKFIGASLSRTTFEKWKAWRAKTLKEFKPIGYMQLPWGISVNGSDMHEYLPTLLPDNLEGYGWLGCAGAHRIRIPVVVQEKLEKTWPAGAPELWSFDDLEGIEKPFDLLNTVDASVNTGNRRPWVPNVGKASDNKGIFTPTGGGKLYINKRKPLIGEFYPRVREKTHSQTVPERRYESLASRVLFKPDMRGFLSCGFRVHPDDLSVEAIGYQDGSGFYLNDQIYWKGDGRWLGQKYLFEGTEFLWMQVW